MGHITMNRSADSELMAGAFYMGAGGVMWKRGGGFWLKVNDTSGTTYGDEEVKGPLYRYDRVEGSWPVTATPEHR